MKYIKTFEEFTGEQNGSGDAPLDIEAGTSDTPKTEDEEQEEIKPEDVTNESEQELNERERLKYIGTYRAKNGKTYKKWKDDENYISIQVNGEYITIEGDGETKTQDEVMKEIEDALKESESVIESAGYIEAMDPDLDTAVMDIRRIFLEWKEGPATERKHIEPARKELLKYIEKQLK